MRLKIISESKVLDNEVVALSRYVKSLRSLKLARRLSFPFDEITGCFII